MQRLLSCRGAPATSLRILPLRHSSFLCRSVRTGDAARCGAAASFWATRRCSTHPTSPPQSPPPPPPAAGTSSASSSPPFPTVDALNGTDVPLTTPDEVESAFACSVKARTVSNAQLRRYLESLPEKDYPLALAAVKGAKSGGLRLNAGTYEALLNCLMNGGQLRASMELYQQMTQQLRMTPTTNMYASLMELCMQRDMPKSCQTLFNDLQKRGLRPSSRNYELMITSLAAEVPPQWERAIEVFDKISGERNSRVSAATYNALMRVYMNMDPFDWRVVYNCYFEMRRRRPRVRVQWESYLILREALRKGRAGYVRRIFAYMDAWIAVTPLRSWSFMTGMAAYFAVMMVLKMLMSYVMVYYVESKKSATTDSVLPP